MFRCSRFFQQWFSGTFAFGRLLPERACLRTGERVGLPHSHGSMPTNCPRPTGSIALRCRATPTPRRGAQPASLGAHSVLSLVPAPSPLPQRRAPGLTVARQLHAGSPAKKLVLRPRRPLAFLFRAGQRRQGLSRPIRGVEGCLCHVSLHSERLRLRAFPLGPAYPVRSRQTKGRRNRSGLFS